MKSSEEKSLRYVLWYYKPGTFDTRRAIRKFELRRQGHTLYRTLLMWVLGVAAIALFVYGLYGWFSTAEKVEPWTQLTAANHTETYVLPDSSRVTLYPESTLRYQKGSSADGNAVSWSAAKPTSVSVLTLPAPSV